MSIIEIILPGATGVSSPLNGLTYPEKAATLSGVCLRVAGMTRLSGGRAPSVQFVLLLWGVTGFARVLARSLPGPHSESSPHPHCVLPTESTSELVLFLKHRRAHSLLFLEASRLLTYLLVPIATVAGTIAIIITIVTIVISR